MQLKDVTPIIKEILEERDKNPLVINTERYIPCYKENQYGNAVRAGLRKALRAIEQAPVVDAVAVVRCKDCKHYVIDCRTCRSYCVKDSKVVGDEVWGGFAVDKNGYCNYGEKRDLEG